MNNGLFDTPNNTSTVVVGLPFTNNGSVVTNSGALTFTGNVTNSGNISGAAGSALYFDGPSVTLSPTSSISADTLQLSPTTLTVEFGTSHGLFQIPSTIAATSDSVGGQLTLVAEPSFVPSVNQTFTLFQGLAANAVTGTFSGLPQGGTVTDSSGDTYTISYGSMTSSNVLLTTTYVATTSTTTSIGASTKSSVYGQPITFTALVSAGSSPALTSGTVTFYYGATPLGTANVANGAASCSINSLVVGSADAVYAVYSGAGRYLTSTSSNVTEAVTADATKSVLSTSGSPSVYSQSVTFTATVSAKAPGMITPSGYVTFTVDGTAIAPVMLVNGTATLLTSTLSVGTHHIKAAYAATANFTGSAATQVTQVVGKASTATTLTSTIDPSVYGQSATFIANVSTLGAGTATPTGNVSFYDGTTLLATKALQMGSATYTTSLLAVASHVITAKYVGNADFLTSTSSYVTQTVNQDGTTVTVTSSVAAPVSGQNVTFTAIVAAASPGAGKPTSTVVFTIDGVVGAPIMLAGGRASYTTKLATGSHTISATYGGDGNFSANTGTLSQTVSQDATKTIVSTSLSPSLFGEAVTFTATVAAKAPGSGTPTGQVTFLDDGAPIGTATLNGGTATYTATGLPVGNQTISVSYAGDSNFNASISGNLMQVVHKAASTTMLAESAPSTIYGQQLTLSATVASSGGMPTGVIIFKSGGVTIGSAALVNGVATFVPLANLVVGSHSLVLVQPNLEESPRWVSE